LLADVTDPRAPRALGRVDTPGHARAVALFGTRAVVADQWEGLRVIDVSDARAPVEIGALATRSWAMDVAIDGTTALVATGSEGLTSVDLSAPTHPREAASLPIAGLASAATAIAVAGGRAAVAAGIGLYLVDASVPSALRLAGAVTPFARAVGVEVASPFVYVSGSPLMTVIDASSPGTAREVGVLGLPGETSTSNYIVRHNEVVYIGTLGGSLIAADVADPSRPVETARVTFPLDGNVYATAVAGSLMPAAVENWFGIFDITDPRKPLVRSTLPMRAEGVAAIGRFAFVGEAGQGLTVIDLADPAAPSIVARYPDAAATAVVAVGNYIYVATCDRVEVVDVSVPKDPKLATAIPVTGCVTIMRRAGESVFLIDRDGIVEIDVSIPGSPSIASRTPLPASRILGLAADDALVAVAAATSGIFLFQRNEDGAAALARRPVNGKESFEIVPHPTAPAPRAPEKRPEPEVVTPQAVAPTARQVIVTSTANDGAGTLRRAIASAVAADVISFDSATFPPQAPATIRLESPMECVPSGVSIDASNAGVVLDGAAIGSDNANGIRLCNSSNVTVKGLQIVNFTGSGFAIDGGSDDTIGGDPARGAGPVGEGNLASGNGWAGITTKAAAARIRIVGNLLGLAPTGVTLVHEQNFGIFAEGSENVIGGGPHERNVIGGNRVGIALGGSRRNTVSGNYIGTDVTGTSIAPAGTASSSQMGVSMVTAHENLVVDNVIAAGTGIVIGDPGASFNRVIGNRIGIGSTGERVAGTLTGSFHGIGVNQPFNLVAGNVISGLASVALHLGANDIFAIGNRIGTDPSGTRAIPNVGTGIRLAGTRAFVGGRSPSERNVVAGNAGSGITLS
ncbi:MAG TPA: NosD domain-containing protein, partial [Thermoanaerobaculia bacterium]|nr:NosD domain-containing protein [Thermoanaerobaculia bacterium]